MTSDYTESPSRAPLIGPLAVDSDTNSDDSDDRAIAVRTGSQYINEGGRGGEEGKGRGEIEDIFIRVLAASNHFDDL